MDPKRSDTIQLAALGRPFSLGMLYDCRGHSLIPGFTLWDYEDLMKDTRKRRQHTTDFDIVTSETIEGKSLSLNVEASLKLSILNGMIELVGSAKYLEDRKTSLKQARVTLKYKTTTEFQELSMNTLGSANVKHGEVFESGMATHVVTGILYGAHAFFVFDQEVSDEENCQKIEGNMKGVINMLPSTVINADGSTSIDDENVKHIEKSSCKFHGDFSLKKNPVSFKEAIEVYQSLPDLLGENGENAVPVKVWLMPLKVLNGSAAQLVREISIKLVTYAQSVLEDFCELELRCKDALKSPVAQQFPQISKHLKDFRDYYNEDMLKFQKTMADILPSIRGGAEEESVLADVLRRRQSSPFNSQGLSKRMDYREREINIIGSLTGMMENTKIVSSQNEFDKIILSPKIQHAICFAFTSLQTAETYLKDLSIYLRENPKDLSTQDNALHTDDVQEEQWYFSKDVYQSMKQKAKHFIDFSEANKDIKNVQFLIAAIPNESQKGASVYLYEDGYVVNDNFEPPSKPETPAVKDITHNSVTLKMCPPRFGSEDISNYSIEYCVNGQDDWQQQRAPKVDAEVTVSNLTPNTEYKFRYRAAYPFGRGPASDFTLGLTLPTNPPAKPYVEASANALSINWVKPTEIGDGVTVESYSVEYAKVSTGTKDEELQWNKLTSKVENVIIPELEPMAEYVVRVRCDCGRAGKSKESSRVTVNTNVLPAELYKSESKLINSGSPSVYQLPLKTEIDVYGCKKYSLGKTSMRTNRTIMVVGATGAGKSTLINGMINYILGMNWNDDYRFKLINEGQLRSQAESQTSEVTAYTINHQEGFKINHSLTIIDTPGFGDTRGIDRDRAITEHIRTLFNSTMGISEIDAVCFITQASLARLTPTQKYVFDSVLSIFGKDIAENIRIMATFADGQLPPVLAAINASNVPCSKRDGLPIHFKFNNSALFADNRSTSGSFDEMFWDMGMTSLKDFFATLETMETKSLLLTKEVLQERKMLETTVAGLQPQLKAGLAKVEAIRMTKQKIKEHEAEISTNENFELNIPINRPVQKEITEDGVFITNCQQCQMTCHYPCHISSDDQKKGCAAMKDENCTVCPRKCKWNLHFNQKYRWEYVKEVKTFTIQKLKDKYEKAKKGKLSIQELMDKQEEEIMHLEEVIMSLVEQSSTCLVRLNEIALSRNPLSTPEYIDLLIEGEKNEAKEGYLIRIQSLESVKEQAKIISKVSEDIDLGKETKEAGHQKDQKEKRKWKLF